MTENRSQRILAILAGTFSFYGAELTEFQAKAWLRVLEGFEVDQVAKAFDLHMMDPSAGQFKPKPADVIKQLQGTQGDRAAVAWSKVLRAIQGVGSWQTVVFDEGAIHAAIEDMGGWPTLCAGTTAELPFIEKRFCTAYKAHLQRGTAYLPKLAGAIDVANAAAGFESVAPVLIGDPVQARRVLENGSTTHRVRFTMQQVAGLITGGKGAEK